MARYRKPLTNLYRAQKESRAWPAILSQAPRGPLWMDANYRAFAQEGYQQHPAVYACISWEVRAMRGMEWGVYFNKGTEKVWIDKGPLNDLVKAPNKRQTFSALVGEWMGCMEISGNAYWEGVSLDNNKDVITRPPSELFVLRPDRMFINPGTPEIPITWYEYRAGSYNIQYLYQMWRNPKTGSFQPRLPVMHSKYWNPTNDFYGFSPMQAAAHNVDSTNSANAWNVGLLQNSSRPSGIFSAKTEMTVEQIKQYTDEVRRQFSGYENAGRPMVLGNDTTWVTVGMNPLEMDFLKSIENDRTTVCMVFGLPPEIIGDSASRTYSNYETAEKAVWNDTVLPKADMLVDDLNLWLSPMFWEAYGKEVYIGYRKDRIEAIQQDQQIVNQNARDLFNDSIITLNEARRRVGEEPDEAGDFYKVPTTCILVPVDKLGRTSNALTNQTINPPKPAAPAAAGTAKPKPKKGLEEVDAELKMLYGGAVEAIKQITSGNQE